MIQKLRTVFPHLWPEYYTSRFWISKTTVRFIDGAKMEGNGNSLVRLQHSRYRNSSKVNVRIMSRDSCNPLRRVFKINFDLFFYFQIFLLFTALCSAGSLTPEPWEEKLHGVEAAKEGPILWDFSRVVGFEINRVQGLEIFRKVHCVL